MSSIVSRERAEGSYWLGQINAPRYVLDLVVLNQLNIDPEEQKREITLDGKTFTVTPIPLIDIGFATEDGVHDAILSAMGYGEEELPKAS